MAELDKWQQSIAYGAIGGMCLLGVGYEGYQFYHDHGKVAEYSGQLHAAADAPARAQLTAEITDYREQTQADIVYGVAGVMGGALALTYAVILGSDAEFPQRRRRSAPRHRADS